MCGIAGFTFSDQNKIMNSLKILEHRGPDDNGFFVDDQVSLGHTRLAILDLSVQASQPMASRDQGAVLLYNGEIYNFKELQKDLIAKNYQFKSASDTEVILNGYLAEGINFFAKLRGMWAFAIYDKKKNILILSRDYFGIKPLYYSKINDVLYFSSEMKSMVSLLGEVKPNTDHFFQYFNLGYFIAPQTCYENIKKLRPGTILIWDFQKKELSELENKLITLKQNYISSFDESVKLLDQQLADSLRAHFVSDVPVGILLSGGNDSSLLAGLSRESGFKPIAYNLNIGDNIDSVYAKKVSRHFNLELYQETLSEKSLPEQYEKIWEIIDEPLADTSIIPTSLIFSVVSAKTKVVLSGEGGDELFGGYLRSNFFAGLNQVSQNNAIVNLTNFLARGTNAFSLRLTNPIVNRLRNKILDNFLNDIIGSYLKEVKILDYPIDYSKIRKTLYDFYIKHSLKNVSANLFFDRYLYLPNDLMYKGDISSMHYSVESRVPFLDKILFGFVINRLKPEYCLSAEYRQKAILKKVLEKYLPKELVYRPKKGFAFSFKRYPCPQFQSDLGQALRFHQKNARLFGINNVKIFNPNNSEIFIKKYDRFAFALVVNWHIFSKIL